MSRWQSKVDALIRLAEDQAGRPEGELARQKLQQILEKYPEAARQHRPLEQYARRAFMMSDLGFMRRHGISTAGRWTGGTPEEAIMVMIADYWQRIEQYKNRPRLLGVGIAAIINDKEVWGKTNACR